jgi:hypothetical protein
VWLNIWKSSGTIVVYDQTYHQPFFSLAFALDIFALCSAALQTKNGKKLPQVQTQLSIRAKKKHVCCLYPLPSATIVIA